PEIQFSSEVFVDTFASIRAHDEARTLMRGLPAVPASVPVLFVHGSMSPMPVRTTTRTAELIPHAQAPLLPEGGLSPGHEGATGRRDGIAEFGAGAAATATAG